MSSLSPCVGISQESNLVGTHTIRRLVCYALELFSTKMVRTLPSQGDKMGLGEVGAKWVI